MVAGEIYQKRILFAVLNWGLGHATRSAVLIRQLLQQNNEVTVVSSGLARQFLKSQFPQLEHHELPAREIIYPAHAQLWLKLILQQKKIFGNIGNEKKATEQLSKTHSPDLIISDNCYGFFNAKIHSILVTHQVNLQSPYFEKAVQKKIHRLLQPFTEIWVPDFAGEENLAGKLSHPALAGKDFTYTGPLSSLNTPLVTAEINYTYCAVVSGPEKQRTIFENEVIDFLAQEKQPSVMVRGTTSALQKKIPSWVRVIDLCDTMQLRTLISQSKIIIGRTGYSTIMDLYFLQKPCLLLPTPGQPEQEYLFAKHFGKVPRALQNLQPRIIWPCKG